MSVADYRALTVLQSFPALATHELFDRTAPVPDLGPLDRFIEDTNAINQLYVPYVDPSRGDLPRALGTMVVLGYTSAVESYFRSLVRRLVLIDEMAAKKAEPLTLSFGAAKHHSNRLLPEALLENYSFAGRKGVLDALKEVLGITNLPREVDLALAEFARVCEVRHCCVHRFGRLGSRNAIKLGLDDHTAVLEQPFAPTVTQLEVVADLLRTFVKTMNNFLFTAILDRTVARDGMGAQGYRSAWSWRWNRDRRRFSAYHELFASTLDRPASPSERAAYDSFRTASGPRGTRWAGRR